MGTATATADSTAKRTLGNNSPLERTPTTSSIHDVVVRDNWADTSTYLNHGTNCPMINNSVFPPGQPTPEAKQIMDFAGVPPTHRWAHVLR